MAQKPKSNRSDETKLPWEKRHTDAMIRWAWNSRTWVTPACKAKGETTGILHYPDGTYQVFSVA